MGWPYHKFHAVRRAYRAEGKRQERAIARAKGEEPEPWGATTKQGAPV